MQNTLSKAILAPNVKAINSFRLKFLFKIRTFEFLSSKNHQQNIVWPFNIEKKCHVIQSPQITLAKVWWAWTHLCCDVCFSAAHHIGMFTYLVHFNLQLKLCCMNVNENTMNQTERHYHFNSLYPRPSLCDSPSLFAHFSLRSAFFANENFPTMFSTHLFRGIFSTALRLILCWNGGIARDHIHTAHSN